MGFQLKKIKTCAPNRDRSVTQVSSNVSSSYAASSEVAFSACASTSCGVTFFYHLAQCLSPLWILE